MSDSLRLDHAKIAPIGVTVLHPSGWSRVRRGGHGRWAWCEYCYRHVAPLTLDEDVAGERWAMALCPDCRHGLTAPVPA